MKKTQFRNIQIYVLILTLFFIGTVVFAYRHFVLSVPLTDAATVNSWMVEANLRFNAKAKAPVKATFSIPYRSPNLIILDEYFVSANNYGIMTNLDGYNRQVVWSLRRGKGVQSLFYRAILRQIDNNELLLKEPPAVKITHLDENQQAAINALIEQVRSSSADIYTFAEGTIKELNKKSENSRLLVGNNFSDENIINAAILILKQVKIYSMAAKGIHLVKQNKVHFKTVLTVYNGKKWFFIDPKGTSISPLQNFLVWHYGSDPIYEVIGGQKISFNIAISPTPINALNAAKSHGMQADSKLMRFSLLQLPVSIQDTYKILLMVPIGAFVILILRNFIGLKTFGTFMPVLIALAFRETGIIWGVFLFTFIITFGLLIRFYLEQLRLLLVPRLAAILTIVVIFMLFISIFSHSLGLTTGLSIALFPMVIITMTIERMCITWDERGPSEAILAALGSLFAAMVAFRVMNYKPLQYLVFAFPELLFILLALILWFGLYRGFRLNELFRFKDLGRH